MVPPKADTSGIQAERPASRRQNRWDEHTPQNINPDNPTKTKKSTVPSPRKRNKTPEKEDTDKMTMQRASSNKQAAAATADLTLKTVPMMSFEEYPVSYSAFMRRLALAQSPSTQLLRISSTTPGCGWSQTCVWVGVWGWGCVSPSLVICFRCCYFRWVHLFDEIPFFVKPVV